MRRGSASPDGGCDARTGHPKDRIAVLLDDHAVVAGRVLVGCDHAPAVPGHTSPVGTQQLDASTLQEGVVYIGIREDVAAPDSLGAGGRCAACECEEERSAHASSLSPKFVGCDGLEHAPALQLAAEVPDKKVRQPPGGSRG